MKVVSANNSVEDLMSFDHARLTKTIAEATSTVAAKESGSTQVETLTGSSMAHNSENTLRDYKFLNELNKNPRWGERFDHLLQTVYYVQKRTYRSHVYVYVWPLDKNDTQKNFIDHTRLRPWITSLVIYMSLQRRENWNGVSVFCQKKEKGCRCNLRTVASRNKSKVEKAKHITVTLHLELPLAASVLQYRYSTD